MNISETDCFRTETWPEKSPATKSLLVSAAAAAKSLQLCLTLCDPMDCSLPGSSIHGIFQARGLEWGAIAFSGALSCSCSQYPDSAHFLVLFPSFGKYQVVFSAAADVRIHSKMKKAKICGCHMAGELGRGG